MSQKLNKGLIATKNSIERLLWFLANSNSLELSSEIGHFFAAQQDNFKKYIFEESTVSKLLNVNELIDNSKRVNPGPNTYMKSDVTDANELFKSRIFVRFKDFEVQSNIVASEIKEIDKSKWVEFLRLYTLLNI